MNTPILAKDIMVTNLITLRPHTNLREATRQLATHKISGAPVVDDDHRLVGMFTEKDVMSALLDAVYDELPSSESEVSVYMCTTLHTIAEDTDMLSIVQTFKSKTFRRLPVVRDGILVGQISRRDVLQAMAKLLDQSPDRKTVYLYLSALREQNETPFD